MAFSIKEFWNNADRKAGFAKPNRFKVKLIIPSGVVADARALELQCETVDLPGKILTTQDVKVYGPAYRMAINKQYSNEITMNFLCTNDGHERNIFDKWLEYINSNNTNNLIYPESYLSNISITQYNETYDGKNESKSKIINEIPENQNRSFCRKFDGKEGEVLGKIEHRPNDWFTTFIYFRPANPHSNPSRKPTPKTDIWTSEFAATTSGLIPTMSGDGSTCSTAIS
jgi:hypothetical protein